MKVSSLIKVPIYECLLHFIVTDKFESAYRKICKQYNLIDDCDSMVGVFLYPTEDTYYLIINKKYLTHNILSHEICHAVTQVCSFREIKDDEARAYLTGFLTGEIYKMLAKKKLIVTHG